MMQRKNPRNQSDWISVFIKICIHIPSLPNKHRCRSFTAMSHKRLTGVGFPQSMLQASLPFSIITFSKLLSEPGAPPREYDD
ncbi:MAG: hypothetical protein ACP5LD_14505, partial [Desulfomonilaceae bacterium]